MQLEKANGTNICKAVDDAIRMLGSAVKREDFLLLATDAARYMVKAGNLLKMLYPNLLHVTCANHALHRLCENIRKRFRTVNELISLAKSVFLKCPARSQLLKDFSPNLPPIPSPVITRWGTWLRAAEFYATHFRLFFEVLKTFRIAMWTIYL